MKRTVLLALALLLCASFAFASGGGESQAAAAETSHRVPVTEDNELPDYAVGCIIIPHRQSTGVHVLHGNDPDNPMMPRMAGSVSDARTREGCWRRDPGVVRAGGASVMLRLAGARKGGTRW